MDCSGADDAATDEGAAAIDEGAAATDEGAKSRNTVIR